MSQAETIANKFFDPTEFIGDQEKYNEVLTKKNELMKELLPYLEVMEMEKEVYNNAHSSHQVFPDRLDMVSAMVEINNPDGSEEEVKELIRRMKEQPAILVSKPSPEDSFNAAREKEMKFQPNMKETYGYRFNTYADYMDYLHPTTKDNGE